MGKRSKEKIEKELKAAREKVAKLEEELKKNSPVGSAPGWGAPAPIVLQPIPPGDQGAA